MATIADADVRKEAVRLWEIWQEAQVAVEAAAESLPEPDDLIAAREAAWDACEADVRALQDRCDELHAARDAKIEALERAHPSRAHLAPLIETRDAALAVYEAAPGTNPLIGPDGEVVYCALTGVPIWEDDEIVEDPETDQVFLRAALGLAPRATSRRPPDVSHRHH